MSKTRKPAKKSVRKRTGRKPANPAVVLARKILDGKIPLSPAAKKNFGEIIAGYRRTKISRSTAVHRIAIIIAMRGAPGKLK